MSETTLRLTVRVGDHRYETVVIERASVIEVRDAPPDVPAVDAVSHSTIVTKHGNYVVDGGATWMSNRIWPAPEKCRECGRPKP